MLGSLSLSLYIYICICIDFDSEIPIAYINKGIDIFSFFSKASFSQASIDLTVVWNLAALLNS